MPTYNFRNKVTGEEWSEYMTISGREKYLEENPDIEAMFSGAPMIVGGVNMKPDNGFREVLQKIKSKHARPNINTF